MKFFIEAERPAGSWAFGIYREVNDWHSEFAVLAFRWAFVWTWGDK